MHKRLSTLLFLTFFPIFISPVSAASKIPLIDVTDLYHPYQDPGDNFDLVAAYGLPEIDLRAVILDSTQPFRDGKLDPEFGSVFGKPGQYIPQPRIDPGFIPVIQLN